MLRVSRWKTTTALNEEPKKEIMVWKAEENGRN